VRPEAAESWKDEALDFVLAAIARSPSLREILVFRGARILYRHLSGLRRPSFDLDAVLRAEVGREGIRDRLATDLEAALTAAAEAADPVVYTVGRVRVEEAPPKPHLRGWDGYDATISLRDNRRSHVRGIPNLVINIAAPETLGPGAVERIAIGGGERFKLAWRNHSEGLGLPAGHAGKLERHFGRLPLWRLG
jgi:hypothetical protein